MYFVRAAAVLTKSKKEKRAVFNIAYDSCKANEWIIQHKTAYLYKFWKQTLQSSVSQTHCRLLFEKGEKLDINSFLCQGISQQCAATARKFEHFH